MIALLQQVSDTAIASAPTGNTAVTAQLHNMLAPAVPNIWVTAGITVGLLILLSYLLRVPHQYPLRGMIMALTALAFAACTFVLGTQIWHRVPHGLGNVKADIKAAEDQHQQAEVDKQPVAALDTYVPPMPGADSAIRHEQPATNGLPSGTVWDETTNQSIAQVVKYYADDNNHLGWQVEFSAPNGMVLRRTTPTGGSLETERLRILARPNVDPHGKKTEVEFELTRRAK